MSILNKNAKIEKCILIDNFSSYFPKQKEIINTSLCIEEFNSKWKINIYPMFPTDTQNESSVYCDVYVNLICEECSAAPKLCKNIKVSSIIQGRENYPTLFELDTSEMKPTWNCAIISHVTLQSLKLVKDNKLQFSLQFCFPTEVLTKCIDGRNDLIHNMEDLFKNPQYSDICLISSSDEKFFVHASVLQSRSNIIRTGKILSLSKYHEYQEESMQDNDDIINFELDINLTDKSALINNYSQSNSSNTTSLIDKYISSPAKKPLFTVSSNISASKMTKRTDSPLIFSPNKSRKLSNSVTPKKKHETINFSPNKSRKLSNSVTPKKKHEAINSPSRNANQMQIPQFFPRSSSLNVKSENGPSLSFASFSPIKGGTSSVYAKTESPSSKSLKENNKTPSKQSLSCSSFNSEIRSPCGVIPRQNVQNLKRKLFEDEVENNRTLTVIKLNISTSVLQELLHWIYTGKSSRLGELSRPLLVAARRHNIKDLFESTQFHLASMISINNVPELLALSHKYEAGILKEEAMQFAVSRASEVTQISSWGDLSVKYPEILLEFSRKLALYRE